MMAVYRDTYNGIGKSPIRQVYGKKGQALLTVLDICLYQMNNSKETLIDPHPPGLLLGAPVKTLAGFYPGDVSHYDWPPVGEVYPIVSINPAGGVNLGQVPSGACVSAQIQVGNRVIIDGLQMEGEIQEPVASRSYIDNSHTVNAYLAKFDSHLQPLTHGLRVLHKDTKNLVGMLISAQNEKAGSCLAYVFPCELV